MADKAFERQVVNHDLSQTVSLGFSRETRIGVVVNRIIDRVRSTIVRKLQNAHPSHYSLIRVAILAHFAQAIRCIVTCRR